MKQVAVIAYYELRRLIQHRSVILLLFFMPLLIIMILGSALSVIFANKPVQAGEIRLAVLMEDNGFIHTSMDRLLAGGSWGTVKVSSVVTMNELAELVGNGDADAGVAVPAGFSEDLRQGLKPEWQFVAGNNPVKNVVSLQVFGTFFDGWNQRFAQSGGWSNGEIPLDMPVTLDPAEDAGDYVLLTGWNGTQKTHSAIQYYSAHMLIMFMLYFGMSAAISLVIAKEDHTLARLRSLPLPAWRIMLGSIAGQGAVLILQSALIVIGTAFLYRVDWGNSPWLIILTIGLMMVFTQSLAIIVTTLTRTRQQVSALFQIFVIVTTFLAGGYTPTIGEILSSLSPYTMNYWAAQSILHLMLHEDPSQALGYIRMLAWFAGGSAMAAALAYWKVGYHE